MQKYSIIGPKVGYDRIANRW